MNNTDYKQTEIGEIPQSWNLVPFGSLLVNKVKNGIYKPKKFHGSGTKVINMGEIFGYDYLGVQEMQKVQLDDNEKTNFIVKIGDLLFARRSLVAEGAGKCSLVVEHDEPLTYESSIILARPDEKKADSNYLLYYFQSPLGRYVIGSILRQVAVSGITGTDLMGVKVIYPSLPEQKNIAKTIFDIDKKIELNNRINNNLEKIGESLFKRWFVDFEFPNEEGKPYISSGGEMVVYELGKIPKGWEVKSLDDIANFLNGIACQKYPAINEADSMPVIKIADLRGGFTQNSDKASSKIDKKYHVVNGDVLFSWSGSLEVCLWPYDDGILNQHLFRVTSENYPKWFYYHWILVHLPDFRTIASGKATTMGHIQRRHLTNAKVFVPDKPTLGLMSSIMQPLLEKIISNNREIAYLKSLRDSLLPRLMSGKLRIYGNN